MLIHPHLWKKRDSLPTFPLVKNFNLIKRLLVFSLFVFCDLAFAQEDCYLGIGGKDDETIIEVFQLDENQVEKMKNWGAELKYRNSFLLDQAKRLLEKHSESSAEELMAMSYEYRDLLDSMKSNMRMLDQRMLSLFKDDQYNLYVKLCNTASRSPIFANRQVNEK